MKQITCYRSLYVFRKLAPDNYNEFRTIFLKLKSNLSRWSMKNCNFVITLTPYKQLLLTSLSSILFSFDNFYTENNFSVRNLFCNANSVTPQLSFNPSTESAKVVFDSTAASLTSGYSFGGRGMELSELVAYNDDILTVCDKTGIVFKGNSGCT